MCPRFRSGPPDQEDIAEAVRHGTDTGMPASPNLTSADIANLAAHLESLRTPDGPTFTHSGEAVPTQ